MASASVEWGSDFIFLFHMPVHNHLSARCDVVWCICSPRSPDNYTGFLFLEQHKRRKCSSRDFYRSWTSQSQLSQLPLLGTLYIKCGKSWIIVSTTIVSPTQNVSSLRGVCKTVRVSLSTVVGVMYANAPIFCIILKLWASFVDHLYCICMPLLTAV